MKRHQYLSTAWLTVTMDSANDMKERAMDLLTSEQRASDFVSAMVGISYFLEALGDSSPMEQSYRDTKDILFAATIGFARLKENFDANPQRFLKQL